MWAVFVVSGQVETLPTGRLGQAIAFNGSVGNGRCIGRATFMHATSLDPGVWVTLEGGGGDKPSRFRIAAIGDTDFTPPGVTVLENKDLLSSSADSGAKAADIGPRIEIVTGSHRSGHTVVPIHNPNLIC